MRLVGRACATTAVKGEVCRIGLVDAELLEGTTPQLRFSAPFTGAAVKDGPANWRIENRSAGLVSVRMAAVQPAAGASVFTLAQDGRLRPVECDVSPDAVAFEAEPGTDYIVAMGAVVPVQL
jgi:hypothetical protein